MSQQACSRCGWPPEGPPRTDSRIGLVFELGRLRKRLGVCVEETETQLVLHIDSKDDRTVELADLPTQTDHTSANDPPAVRLHRFEALRQAGAIRTKTDPERLRALIAAWTRDAATIRATYDAALEGDWADVLEQLELSPVEKAWRNAHHAATLDDLDGLVDNLALLPVEGYLERIGLLLPHLTELAETHTSRLVDIIARWDESLPGAAAVLARLQLGHVTDPKALSGSARYFSESLAGEAGDRWESAVAMLDEGKIGEPVRETCTTWAAYRAFSSLESGRRLDEHHLARLTLPFLEQLVAVDGVTVEGASRNLSGQEHSYLLARLDPASLGTDQLVAVRHTAELARRAFDERNQTSLSSLPDDDPAVRHYRALHNFRDGEEYTPDDLREFVREKLDLFASARKAVAQGEADTLPDRLLDDPTLWPALQQLALDGKLTVGLDQRMVFPEFAEWVDLHALVAMLWKGENFEADALGARMASTLEIEQLRDEALNLRAFALSQLGRYTEALEVMEDAMAGEYTEALLINTCLIASQAEPEVAARYLARLINEAPNQELQVAALRQAITIWTGDEQMPEETARSLRTVLQIESLADQDYIDFIRLQSNADRDHMVDHPPARPTTLTKAVAHDVYLARALSLAGRSEWGTMSRVLIASMGTLPEAPWVGAELDRWVDLHFDELTSRDWGDAPWSASEFDTFLKEGEQYLSRPVYYFGAPLAGINIAKGIADGPKGRVLSDEAAAKFFYLPAERFVQGGDDLPEELAKGVGYNFYQVLSMFIAILFDSVMTDVGGLGDAYNELNQRRSWDQANEYALTSKMRRILDQQLSLLKPIDRAFGHLDKFEPSPDRPADLIKTVDEWRRDVAEVRDELIQLRARL